VAPWQLETVVHRLGIHARHDDDGNTDATRWAEGAETVHGVAPVVAYHRRPDRFEEAFLPDTGFI
jgi:hypothetical protein